MKCEICGINEARYVCISCKRNVCASCYRSMLGLCTDCAPVAPLKEENVEELRSLVSNCVKEGDFVLTSGRKSNYYVDIKGLITQPAALQLLGRELSWRGVGYDGFAGVELGAVPLVVAASLYSGKPYVIIRKEKREHGVEKEHMGQIEGKRLCIIEDVTTTGETALRATKVIRSNRGYVDRVVTVVDREEGAEEILKSNKLELVPLFRISDLKNG
ncbi:MAG: orotate phosphoribosyltransferase [Candidatus Thermoplasmatota archaeon]|nr:orotate phosphoribosyltransferase [Candidatus Thermoplasmatota archaeon]